MHGGRSTGPRPPDGIARVRTARTIHGRYGAETRAWRRHVLTMLRRGTVFHDAFRYAAHLPPDMVVRLHGSPPELALPRFSAGCLSRAEDRAVMWAEAEALAPWKQAIALAKEAGRRDAAPPAGSDRTDPLTGAEVHAPEQPPIAAAASGDRAGAGNISAAAEALAPWKQAIALAKEAGRRNAAPPAGSDRTDPLTGAEVHAPEQPPIATAASGDRAGAGNVGGPAEGHAPEQRPDAAAVRAGTAGAGNISAAAKAHAPEQPPAARSDPAAIGDAGAREEALATEQQMVATVASTVPVASRDGQAKAKPLATEQATDTRQWDGIRLRPPSQAISLRQQLLAATDHDNLTAWAARVAGWGMIAEAVTTFGAAPLI